MSEIHELFAVFNALLCVSLKTLFAMVIWQIKRSVLGIATNIAAALIFKPLTKVGRTAI